jgi:hypothetical protein
LSAVRGSSRDARIAGSRQASAPIRITPVAQTYQYRPDLMIDLEPYTVAVVEIAGRR